VDQLLETVEDRCTVKEVSHTVHFQPGDQVIQVPDGMLIADAAHQAGIEINMPCGGQGRCGRCAVLVRSGDVRRRSTIRLTAEDIAAGYALACQTVITGDVEITIPPQEQIVRRLRAEKAARKVELPFAYMPTMVQPVRAFPLRMEPPSLADQTDDWARVWRALRKQHGLEQVVAELPTLRRLGATLREADWRVTAIVEMDSWDRPDGPPRLMDVIPEDGVNALWGIALDIGTTTVSLYLVDLISGQVRAQAADYNGQIARGEDVISRIIYASKEDGLAELQQLVVETVNRLIHQVTELRHVDPRRVYKMTVAGNPTMLHLFLAVPPASIRLMPFVPAVNYFPTVRAGDLGLCIHPAATVDPLPGVASYVGADIAAGVLSSGLADKEELTLFLDIGTNGEMVLGTFDWLITCACSAGPAFEGAGVEHGMRATLGAIEEVWINSTTYEPTLRVIGEEQGEKPRGLCGSGLISLLAEMFITGIIDKAGHFVFELPTPRVREGAHGGEYVVAWADETAHGQDIVITKVDIDNLLRAKAAIYAGCSVLAQSVGVDATDVSEVLIGGAFGQHLNVEKAIQLGLLPDLPWDRFRFLGNTALRGAYMALLSRDAREQLRQIADRMTYLELSADNTFYDQFTSALFLPHTEIGRFPSVANLLAEAR